MRYVVYGAGAVGGVIGGNLHLAGLATTLVARGEHLERIRADGLLLDQAGGPRTVSAPDLRTAGFESVARPDIMAWKHRKLLMNLGNGVDAACAPSDAADVLVERARAEGEQVIAAAGIACVSEAADTQRRGDLLRRRTDLSPAGGSTWQSLTRGASGVEIDYLAGEIVLLGRLHGVPTPVNELIQRTVVDLARAGRPPRSVEANDLLGSLR